MCFPQGRNLLLLFLLPFAISFGVGLLGGIHAMDDWAQRALGKQGFARGSPLTFMSEVSSAIEDGSVNTVEDIKVTEARAYEKFTSEDIRAKDMCKYEVVFGVQYKGKEFDEPLKAVFSHDGRILSQAQVRQPLNRSVPLHGIGIFALLAGVLSWLLICLAKVIWSRPRSHVAPANKSLDLA